jgi:UDP-N-acetylmuramoyl-L-alanyl-D-glutamate--2,6-diaminopimelate ligase
MRLSALAKGFAMTGVSRDPDITLVTEDSRKVRPGAMFVAVGGTSRDGHDFVRDALDRGAAAIVVERADAVPPGVPTCVVPSGRQALAALAARFHGEPARALQLIGFTGTFGKTTTSDILRALLEADGRRPGVLGSLGARYGSFSDPGDGLTTPMPPELHGSLAALRRAGADIVIMEVTSHALRLGRVEGLTFRGGLLSAIVPGEHTDFHRSYEDYVAAKRRLLLHLAPESVLAFDGDNRAARRLAADANVAGRSGFTMGGSGSDLHCVDAVRLDAEGTSFTIDGEPVRSSLLGRPNVRNAALAASYALAVDVPFETIRRTLPTLRPLPRRMQRLTAAGRTILDDTSGHADSLTSVFDVVALLPREKLWIAWAIRGSRGADVNRRNALALADFAALHEAQGLVVTSAEDLTAPKDAVTSDEVDAVREALRGKGRPHTLCPTLEEAMKEIARRSGPGDLVVVIGAQGMNEGVRLLQEMLLDEERPG